MLWLPLSILASVVIVACIVWLARSRDRPSTHSPGPGATNILSRPATVDGSVADTSPEHPHGSEFLRLAAELEQVGVWFWDVTANAHQWKDRFTSHLCLPPNRTSDPKDFYSLIHDEDREWIRALVDQSFGTPRGLQAVYRIMHQDGTHHWMATMGWVQPDGDGEADSLGGVTIDATRLTQLANDVRHSELLAAGQASELRDFRRQFRLIAENATDVVVEMDTEGTLRWITPSATQRLGLPPDRAVGERFTDLVHPDDWTRAFASAAEAKRGTPGEAELRLRIGDGGYHWFSVRVRPLFDDGPTMTGLVAGCRDIHREVSANDALVAERYRLRATLSGIPDPLVILQPVRNGQSNVSDFIYFDASPSACAFIGITRDRLLGSRLLESFPAAESSGLLRALANLVDTGRPMILDDFPSPTRGAGLRRLDIRGLRMDHLVSLAWRDVTDRHEASDTIAASEQRFRLLAENSLDVVMLIDKSDKVLWASPSVMPVLGWRATACVGHDAADFLATDEYRKGYRETTALVATGQGAVTRVQLRDAAGVTHWAEVHASPFRTPEGRIEGVVSSMRIVDTEVRMQQALERRARTDELTQLLNRKESLERLDAFINRRASVVAALWCDIDGFKSVNDVHGHAGGDAVLRALADRMRGCLRAPQDIGARLGGDELLVVLCDVHDVGEAVHVAETLRQRAAEPVQFGDGVIQVTISVGVALARPDDSVDGLLARADDAMYRAKHQGKNRVVAAADLDSVSPAS